MAERKLTYNGFRVMLADLTTRIKELFAAELETFNANYAGAVYISQAEYDALTDEQKNDPTKVYFIEEQL